MILADYIPWFPFFCVVFLLFIALCVVEFIQYYSCRYGIYSDSGEFERPLSFKELYKFVKNKIYGYLKDCQERVDQDQSFAKTRHSRIYLHERNEQPSNTHSHKEQD